MGSNAYLKNFRKGLRKQREMAQEDVDKANDEGGIANMDDVRWAVACMERLQWVIRKQRDLDERGVMVADRPV